ncbi:hypothetical protein ACOMHN_057912 [Nucella lapillus]
MRGRWKRIYLTVALLTIAGLAFYNNESKSGPRSSLQWEYNNNNFLRRSGYHNEGSLLEWSHFSVFQQWRQHHPRPLVQSTPEDCLQLKGPGNQRTCYQRLQHVRQYCSKLQAEEAEGDSFSDLKDQGDRSVNDSVVDVFSYQQRDRLVMYCNVHKVASTFWVSLFRFLHNDTSGGPVSSPEVLSKYRVHLTPFKQSRPFASAYFTRKLQPEKGQFRFMFTRNPYRRLWAVYIDKFVLPDYFFWSHHAGVIQDMILEKLYSANARKPPKPCFDASFENFVVYTVQDESSSFRHSDDHMLPVSRVCNPCAFQPHFIGRLENMAQDSQAVLERLNLTHVVKQKHFQERALNHMRTIVDFVYYTVAGGEGLRHCISDENLQARVIRAFVLCGYLPAEVAEIPRTPVAGSPVQMFNMIKDFFLDFNRKEEEVVAQREKIMIGAYNTLPRGLLYQVRDYYRDDFHMFGYHSEPPELFSQRDQRERRAVL